MNCNKHHFKWININHYNSRIMISMLTQSRKQGTTSMVRQFKAPENKNILPKCFIWTVVCCSISSSGCSPHKCSLAQVWQRQCYQLHRADTLQSLAPGSTHSSQSSVQDRATSSPHVAPRCPAPPQKPISERHNEWHANICWTSKNQERQDKI